MRHVEQVEPVQQHQPKANQFAYQEANIVSSLAFPLSHAQLSPQAAEASIDPGFKPNWSLRPIRRRRMSKQNGTIVQRSGRWYLRYWETRNVDGRLVRKRVSHCLCNVTTRGMRPPAEVENAAADFMQTINNTLIPVEQNVSVGDFVESVYLPWIKQNRRPSTHKNARDVWRQHIRPLISRERHTVRAIRTFTVQGWLNQIGQEDLSRNSLKRTKSTLSGMFTLAKQLGYLDGVNPVQGTSVNPRARDAEETYAYSWKRSAQC